MGDAKRRGTFAQRQEGAIAREREAFERDWNAQRIQAPQRRASTMLGVALAVSAMSMAARPPAPRKRPEDMTMEDFGELL